MTSPAPYPARSAGARARRRLVLASASTGRLGLLRAAGLHPETVVSGVDESAVTARDPRRLVQALADAKAAAVAGRERDALVVGCDSLLLLDGRTWGKPADEAEARRRWARQAGRSGELLTGHCLLDVRSGAVAATARAVGVTTVRFGVPDAAELDAYLASGEPMRVAGAFTLDGLGAPFVEGIDGDPGNVVGLSLPLLRQMLAEVGTRITDLW